MVFGQKKLQEQFGFNRIHEITSFSIDTLESGEIQTVANIMITREGNDGIYKIDIDETVWGSVDDTIEYLATRPDFFNYKIIEL